MGGGVNVAKEILISKIYQYITIVGRNDNAANTAGYSNVSQMFFLCIMFSKIHDTSSYSREQYDLNLLRCVATGNESPSKAIRP